MLDYINIIDDKIVNDLRTQPVKKLFEYDNTIVDKIAEALEKMELSPTIRGEALSLEQFAQLSNLLK